MGYQEATPELEERREELDRQRKVLKRSKLVPYDFMDRAKAALEERFPGAEVKPRFYNNQVYCEVWKDGAAKIYFCYER